MKEVTEYFLEKEINVIAKIEEIESLDMEGLETYRTLRRHEEHNKSGIFVAEGNKVVLRLLRSRCEIMSILITGEWLDLCRSTIEDRPEPIEVYVTTKSLLKGIVGFNYHQGVMATAKIPGSSTLDEVCADTGSAKLFVAFDYLSSAENVGVIMRNCAACGVDAIISGSDSSDPYLRRSVRNSMGAVFMLPVVYVNNLAESLRELRCTYGFSTVAADLNAATVSLHDVDFTGNSCVVLGNEHCGVSEAVQQECDTKMIIPMHRSEIIDSFNVGCASAIILHEAFRQRLQKSIS